MRDRMNTASGARILLHEKTTDDEKRPAFDFKGLDGFDSESLDELRDDRKIYLDDEIDANVLAIQRLLLRWNIEDAGRSPEDRKPIVIYICSYGGDRDYMWSLIDAIRASETPVQTVNVGIAYSAAGLIFMAGHRRSMFKNARVLIHDGFAMMAGDGRKVLDASDNYRVMHRKMLEFITERTGLTMNDLEEKSGHDWIMDAEYCLKHKVCDTVIDKLSEVI